MAKFYDVPVRWMDKTTDPGRGIGNNVAWKCKCDEVLVGPHEDLYSILPCPKCGRRFRIHRGKKPQFVARVEEIEGAAPTGVVHYAMGIVRAGKKGAWTAWTT